MTDAAGTAREVANSRPVKYGARVGLVAYGITYLLIAWLALQVAFGDSGERMDQNGAFQTIGSEPFGQALLWVLVVGFVAVALWRLEQAIFATGGVQDQSEQIKKSLLRLPEAPAAAVDPKLPRNIPRSSTVTVKVRSYPLLTPVIRTRTTECGGKA